MKAKRGKDTEAPQFDAGGYQANIRDLNGEALPDLDKLEFRPLPREGRADADAPTPRG